VSAAGTGRRPARSLLAIGLVAIAAGALVITYLALGGGEYKPREVADPCKPRSLPPAQGLEESAQQIALSALDGAACRLRVPREELLLALTTSEERARFLREHRIGDSQLEDAVRRGLGRAVEDAERAGRISETEAELLGAAVEGLPIGTLIDVVRDGRGLADAVGGLLGG